jgi:hypothetical protein
MIWTYGSLDKFWTQAERSSVEPGPVHHAIREARPGHFLFVGLKKGTMRGSHEKGQENEPC